MLSIPRRAGARRGSRGSAVVAAAALVVTVIPAIALSSPSTAAAPRAASALAPSSAWSATSERAAASSDGHVRQVSPSAYRAYTLDDASFAASLAGAPREGTAAAARGGVTVRVPAPNGRLVDFTVVQSNVLAPELRALHPDFKTYVGKAVGYADSISIQILPGGTHVAVRGSHPSWYIDPAYQNDDSLYLSYFGTNLPSPEKSFAEPELDRGTLDAIKGGNIGEGTNGLVKKRTYRLALLTDPSYAEFVAPGLNDGTQEAASDAAVLAAKTLLISRVNDVYGDDLGIELQLIGQTDKLNLNRAAEATGTNGPCGADQCFTVANLDPANGCLGSLLTRNRLVVGQLVGAGNFDIGHIGLGINGGGIASLAVVGGNQKAQGCTGLPFPTGDFYAIDYVAHEMGHQFAGNHTFNGTQLNCSGGNRSASTSVEPGSGTSVMAYAGICQQDNLQPHSDPYFSQRSQTEIGSYVNSQLGNVNEVQSVAFTSFDATDSFTLTFPGVGTTATIERGTNYTAAGIKAAIENTFTAAGQTGVIATVAGHFGNTFGDSGFQVTYTGTAAGIDVVNPTLNIVSGAFTSLVNDIAKGGPPTNGGVTVTTTANHNPVVSAPASRSIPLRTPFALTGSATDSDGDSLLYLWEQDDRGSALGTGLVDNNKVNGPLFRVFGKYADVSLAESLLYYSPDENLADSNPTRVFPDLDQVLADNTNAEAGACPAAPAAPAVVPTPVIECYAEYLPTSTYNGDLIANNAEPSLDFRLTARDNKGPEGGTDFANVKLLIDKTAGPFQVTSQAAPVTYPSASAQTVTWDVNNTNKPSLAPNVKISFSEDGGQTFPIVLAASTPNDGSESVTMPVSATTTGRIKIEAVGNYFFDVNDAPVTLTKSFTVTHAVPATVNTQYSDGVNITFSASSDFGDVTATPAGLPAGLALTKTSGTASGVLPSTGAWSVTGTVTVAPGSYPVTFTIGDGVSTPQTITTTIVVAAEDATATYTGPSTAEAPMGGNDVVLVPLSAHVVQTADGNLGDLTTATVTIKDTIANEVLCANLPVNAGGDASCTYSADIPLQSGRSYNLQLQVGGRFIGTGAGSLSVTIDHTDPETTITSGPAEGSYLLGTAADIGFTSNESPVTYTCTLDGSALVCPSSPASLSGLSAITHRFTVTATDQAGNADKTPASRSFTVPVDDAALASTAGSWKRGSDSGAYRGTISTSKKKGSTLSLTVSGATSLALIASTAKKGGTVKVFLNGQLLKSISLKGPATDKVIIPVATFSTAQSGTVTIVNDTTKAKKKKKQKSVVVDGLGVITAP